MAKTVVIAGFGPGISSAVADRFGAAGFALALVGRSSDRLATGQRMLAAKGYRVETFPTDLAQPDAVRAMIAQVRAALGPIAVLHWNAYGRGAGDALAGDDAGLRNVLDIAVTGLTAGVQAALPDLRAAKGAVLVTNGGIGLVDPTVDAFGVRANVMGLSIGNAAKHKLVALLAAKLLPDGIYVGEVIVTRTVKGTAFDTGDGVLAPTAVADQFWSLYQARAARSVTI